MQTRRFACAMLAVGVMLAFHDVRADTVPPIRSEQEPAAASSPAS